MPKLYIDIIHSYVTSNDTSSRVLFNFMIGALIALFSTFMSSLGVILQAASLEEDRKSGGNNLITVEDFDSLGYESEEETDSNVEDERIEGSNPDRLGINTNSDFHNKVSNILKKSSNPNEQGSSCINGSVIDIYDNEQNSVYHKNYLVEKIASIVYKFNKSRPYYEIVDSVQAYLWYFGFSIYVLSQLFGAIAALSFISPVVIAPLGAFGLVFNVILSYLFLGVQVGFYDCVGTGFIVFGCATISTFASAQPEMRDGPKVDDFFKYLTRPTFEVYFGCQILCVFLLFTLGKYLEYGPMIFKIHKLGTFESVNEQNDSDSDDKSSSFSDRHSIYESATSLKGVLTHRKNILLGMIFSICGGVVASQTLLMTKAGIDVLIGAFFESSERNIGLRFALGFIIFLTSTAVLQLYSLNRALRYALPTLVIPTFYTFFTVFSLVSMVIFLDQYGEYATPDIAALSLGLFSLITGVYFLANKSDVEESIRI